MGMFSNSIAIIDDDIFVEIKDMLFEAKKDEKVYLVTPYVRFDDKIREQIKDAKARKVDVRLLVRKGEERTDEDSTFLANNGIEVRELAYLHAKVYLSKRLGVISSINLYDISDKRNKEVAVIIQSRFKLKAIFEIVERWWSNAEKVSALKECSQKSDSAFRVVSRYRLITTSLFARSTMTCGNRILSLTRVIIVTCVENALRKRNCTSTTRFAQSAMAPINP